MAYPLPTHRPPREEIGADECLCDYCGAKCCRYFALPIDEPENWGDYDYIRWYLLHEKASVFIEDDSWYLLVHNPCRHLDENHRCMIYPVRPSNCREYTTKNCEYEDSWVYDHYWETAEQVFEYAEAVLGPKKGGTFRSPQAGVDCE